MVQALGSVMRHEGVKSALGSVRDKATAARIRAAGGVGSAEGQLAELDLAIRKATSHEDIVPKEKHVATLKRVSLPPEPGRQGFRKCAPLRGAAVARRASDPYRASGTAVVTQPAVPSRQRPTLCTARAEPGAPGSWKPPR